MNSRRYSSMKGFTLIEILIVVIILGILAAIVIPQFTSASTEARESNLRSQLQTLRSQIALYKLQHKDVAPAKATFWDQLTTYSDVSGGMNATKDATHVYGPYYEAHAKNPLTDSDVMGAYAGDASSGWAYDETTGKIRAMNSKTAADIFVE